MFQNNEGKSPQPPFIKGGNVVATLGKGGGTNVPMGLRKFTLTRLRHFLPEVEIKESCHPEQDSGTQVVLTPHPSPLPLWVMENQASLGKGGGTEVPEGLRKFTLTRIAKFTKFIKQFNPLTKREGKELGHTKFDSGTYTVLTPHPGPLPQGARENQASLGKESGTEVPEDFKKKKAAFTLAEVLITLGIIGIVAAMTLPAVVNKYQKLVTSARLKKFYSSMNQAILMAESEHGSSAYWNRINFIEDGEGQYKYNEGAVSILNTYILPYVKYLKLDKGSLPVEDSEGNVVQDGEFPTVYFADGTTMQVVIGSCFDIYFDSNGMGKPNTKGVDQFIFYFCYGNNRKKTTFSSLIPEEDANTYEPRAEALRICKIIPDRCSILLEKYDNFEFKEDYPW